MKRKALSESPSTKRKALSEWARRRFDGSWVAAPASENANGPLDDRFLRRFSDSCERVGADESSDDEGVPSRHRAAKSRTHAAKDAIVIDQRAVLRLSNLNYGTTAIELSSRFSEYGRIVTCELDTDGDTGQRTGRAVIRFDHPSGANAAAEAMDGLELGGRTINCRVAGRGGAEGGYGRYCSRPEVATVRCARCGAMGHRAKECTAPTSVPCPLCGVDVSETRADGHQLHLLGIECPAVSASQAALDAVLPGAMLCTKCGRKGHDSAECVRRRIGASLQGGQGGLLVYGARCMRCSTIGHGLTCGENFSDSVPEGCVEFCAECGSDGHHTRDSPHACATQNLPAEMRYNLGMQQFPAMRISACATVGHHLGVCNSWPSPQPQEQYRQPRVHNGPWPHSMTPTDGYYNAPQPRHEVHQPQHWQGDDYPRRELPHYNAHVLPGYGGGDLRYTQYPPGRRSHPL